eukprot:m.63618 g.63618  ORF g.63618 m.63618 type:complete len:411 (-) comp17802_c0_seq2:1736-2968(-)
MNAMQTSATAIASCLLLLLCSSMATSTGCTTDSDCQLNGLCTGGTCVCDAAWGGSDCSVLQFAADGELAYGGPDANVTSWGGGPPVFDTERSLWVLFVTEIANHCGLSEWQRQSTAVAATSPSVSGPFTRDYLAVPTQAHNPYYVYDPASKTHLIFHIGGGDNPDRSNLTCVDGTTPAVGVTRTFPQRNTVYSAQPYVHAAKSLSGPWTRVNITLPPNGQSSSAWGSDNPAPFIFPNGTLLMLTRKYNGTAAKLKIVPHDTIWLVTAPSYLGPYTFVHDEPLFSDYFKAVHPFNEEDPCIWQDARNNFHALFHFTRGHAWSPDGLSWSWGGGAPAWTMTVADMTCGPSTCKTAPGEVATVKDTERPRVWVNPITKLPTLFFVASGGNTQPTGVGKGEKGFTIVRKLKTTK